MIQKQEDGACSEAQKESYSQNVVSPNAIESLRGKIAVLAEQQKNS